jgi:hypothetical protein
MWLNVVQNQSKRCSRKNRREHASFTFIRRRYWGAAAVLLALSLGASAVSAGCVPVERAASPGFIASDSFKAARVERAVAIGRTTSGAESSVNIPIERTAGEPKLGMAAVELATKGASKPVAPLERAPTVRPSDGTDSARQPATSSQSECRNLSER